MVMDEDIKQAVRQEIIQNFSMLNDEEKELLRANKGTAYTQVLRKLLPQGILDGLSSGEPQGIATARRGLGTR
jgi:hypothetical protein|tara:strand:- start:23 stop:241 length:219 start_codon:yes stop_codon:yes gene_type:complete